MAAAADALLRRQAAALTGRAVVHRELAELRAYEARLRQLLVEESALEALAEAEVREATVDFLEIVEELGGDDYVKTCAEVVNLCAELRGDA